MVIKCKSAKGALPRTGVGNEDGVYRIYGLVQEFSELEHKNNVMRGLTVRIPRLPAFSSPCIPKTDGIAVCLLGWSIVYGCSSANFNARKSSPRLPLACCAVQERCPNTARRTVEHKSNERATRITGDTNVADEPGILRRSFPAVRRSPQRGRCLRGYRGRLRSVRVH